MTNAGVLAESEKTAFFVTLSVAAVMAFVVVMVLCTKAYRYIKWWWNNSEEDDEDCGCQECSQRRASEDAEDDYTLEKLRHYLPIEPEQSKVQQNRNLPPSHHRAQQLSVQENSQLAKNESVLELALTNYFAVKDSPEVSVRIVKNLPNNINDNVQSRYSTLNPLEIDSEYSSS